MKLTKSQNKKKTEYIKQKEIRVKRNEAKEIEMKPRKEDGNQRKIPYVPINESTGSENRDKLQIDTDGKS